jgi:hypothetical protein
MKIICTFVFIPALLDIVSSNLLEQNVLYPKTKMLMARKRKKKNTALALG